VASRNATGSADHIGIALDPERLVGLADRSGISGRQIDGAAPVRPETPPIYVPAGGLAQTGETFGSRLSGGLPKGQPLEDPPNVVFPTLVVALFGSDIVMAQEV
jgi:hypothetical protein